MSEQKIAISGVVLAGGRGRRMNGKNKALLQVDGHYLFEHAVRNLATVTHDIIISSSRDRSVFEQRGFTVVDDGEFADRGPLAGIHAALTRCNGDYLAIAACDQLDLPDTVYATLCNEAAGTPGVYAVTDHAEVPTCAVISCALKNTLQQSLRDGALRLTRFMQENCRPLKFRDVAFHNINTEAALQRVQER
ncbi:MAG: molybdenum cofactor guanylyltransferase [Gammaproteobacteria bacterium]|nr:molybdenum cofactor guanylyltransferase [Gammaproteobacteria bacterium]